MGNKPDRLKPRVWLLLFAGAVLFMIGCATSSMNSDFAGEATGPVIQSVKVNSSLERTVIEIASSKSAPYTAFKLMDPPRVILDIEGRAGKDLPLKTSIYNGNVKEILFQELKAQPAMTRMVIALVLPLEHEISAAEGGIKVVLLPKQAATPVSTADAQNTPPVESNSTNPPNEPRIFFDAKSSDLQQVLGIDFSLLGQGKSRVMVTTDKKTNFDVDRKDLNAVVLRLPKATIPSILLKEIDSSRFEGVVERIRPAYSPSEKLVTVSILLKEMVPYHVDQNAKGIQIDFGATSIKPSEKAAIPLQVVQAAAGPSPVQSTFPATFPGAPVKSSIPASSGLPKQGYTGTPMTMDFVNADVTNILRLIGEISNLNIVWGPEVRGTVSMRLKNVPWDQALDLVLANNSLAKREDGNVIWVTTKAQMTQVEAEERRKREDKDKEVEDRIRREKASEQKEEMKTAYLTVNYKDVNNIRDIIDRTVRSEGGKITVDPQTKTIIYYDKISKIGEARSLKERLDLATPQVVIEARIIEANTSFSRSFGVQWNAQSQVRTNREMTWAGAPPWAVDNVPASFPNASKLYSPSFSTGFSGLAFPKETIGFSFTKLSRGALTGIHLDAALSLSEAEGKTRTLSAPKIVTRDTVKATIQQGTKIVIPSGTDANGNKTYTQVDASLKLEVKPLITPNNMVIMEVVVKDDQPDYANAIGENIPINTKEATTTMMVGSGDTVVIGGIYKETSSENVEGIPGLSKIPLLGWFFKAEADTSRRVELLIFLTPTVLML